MPAKSLGSPWFEVVVHGTAREFLTASWQSLYKQEPSANTILPHAVDILSHHEIATPSLGYDVDNFWLTCWSLRDGTDPVLDLVLSCTSGSLGDYPIFLYSAISSSETTQTFLEPRIRTIINTLINIIPVTRVFSVFGPTSVVKNFSKQWTYITGMQQESEPLYAATFSHATRDTLTTSIPVLPGNRIRRATLRDAPAVSQLFKEFAHSSVHYPLSYTQSLQEAVELIRKQQVWVYQTRGGQIASVVAATRSSPNVTAITKVYTTFAWRKRGFAEHLVRRVTRELLQGKDRVVLYVSHGNPAAKVYHRVGFVGLDHRNMPERDEWLEVGFKDTQRGHW